MDHHPPTREHYPRWTLLALPITRLNLPGTRRLCMLLKISGEGNHGTRWRCAPYKSARDRSSGYRISYNLAEWTERMTYFLGRYPENEVVAVLHAGLRPGDTFVDGGSHVGLLSLLAAGLVGPGGHVHALEPNPSNSARIVAALESNAITHVTVHQVALGDEDTTAVLHLFSEIFSGTGTLGTPDPRDARDRVVETIAVRVVRGDDVLRDAVTSPLFIKLDVEGYECRALRGMEDIMQRHRPAVLTECLPRNLARVGDSPTTLFSAMQARGYEGFLAEVKRSLLTSHLSLRPLQDVAMDHFDKHNAANVLWLHPQGPFRTRYEPCLEAST